MGTLPYASPEMWDGEYSYTTDIWYNKNYIIGKSVFI